jgi:peptidoglycan hydrolase-like protein with peptidoglycan-binding domain
MLQIRYGSVNQAARILQRLLGITADGQFGPKTLAAVQKFQRTHGLAVDGICGPLTWAALATAQPELRQGSKGNTVMAVQDLLGIAIDGKFGPQTNAAVETLQNDGGLKVDGIVGTKTWAYLLTQYVPAVVPGLNPVQPVDLKQYDKRWAKTVYSNHGDKAQTIKSSGCGPTATADILATLVDATITPVETCAMAVANGFRTDNDGTAQNFFPWIAKKYKFSRYYETTSTAEAIKALQSGAYVVALMGKGYWTKDGHYITLWKYAGGNIYANDPASSLRKYASVKVFEDQSRKYFVFFK